MKPAIAAAVSIGLSLQFVQGEDVPLRLALSPSVSVPVSGSMQVEIENTSDRTLVVNGVKMECSCQPASINRRILAPGDKSIVTFPSKSSRESNGNTKHLVLLTSDAKCPTIVLTIPAK